MNLGDEGLEPTHDFTEKVGGLNKSGAHSGARGDANAILADDDPRLLRLIDAWPTLSEDTRDAIARLATGPDDTDDLDDVTAAPDVKPVSR